MVSKVLTQRELTVGFQPGQHLNISEIVDTYVGTLSETFGIAVGPPVAHVAILVIVASLVVEAVGHLMTYDHANSTIVEGIIGISIEERRLEDTCGEANLIGCGVVVSIDGLWCHVPLVAVNRLACFVSYRPCCPELAANLHILVV